MNFNPRIEPAPPEWGASPSPGCGARLARMLAELLQTVVVATIIFLAVNLVTARIRVEGSSMEPSLHDGELVVVNRLAYRWNGLQRGDFLALYFPMSPALAM